MDMDYLLLLALPVVLAAAVLGLAIGGTGFLRLHLVLVAALAAGALWLAAASRYAVGIDSASGVGLFLLPQLQRAYSALGVSAAALPLASAEFALFAAPFLFAAALGCHALLTIGVNLYRFNDCEEAAAELTKVRHGRWARIACFACVSAVCRPQRRAARDAHGASFSPFPAQDVQIIRNKLAAKGFKSK